ncbi:hypothetical protein ACFC14_05600 [Microbacterium sp. NPDC055988]|uniref:hypothetical protein n=1 Tax=Microbacterium sp. NPDC055988 TaxID=3345671 RepID=UPI0035DFBCF8
MQALLASLLASSAGGGPATAVLKPAALAVEQGGSALILLLPASIALQLLLRMPRDPENHGRDDAVAHRQFWGRVAFFVALASSYVALSTFVGACAQNLPAATVNVVEVFGVPIGATLTMLIAADAAVQADAEAARLELGKERVARTVGQMEAALRRVIGRSDPHPKTSMGMQGAIFGLVFIGVAGVGVHQVFHDGALTGVFVIFALVLTLFAVGTAVQVLPSLLQSKILDVVVTLVPPAMVTVVVAMEAATTATAMRVGGEDDTVVYLQGLGYGLALPLPAAMTVAVLLIPRGRGRVTSPLFSVARQNLELQIARLQQQELKAEPRVWRALAGIAICVSPLPPLALVLAIAATWQRRLEADARRGLIIAGWVVSSTVAVLELAALALLPIYGAALGWFSLS